MLSRLLRATAAGVLALTAVAFARTDAQACSCVPPPPPADALAQATAVFEARVARVETDTTALRTTAHLILLRQWKGDLPEDVTVTTASASSLCGYTFMPNERVLLYADGEPDGLSVSLCSRSRPVERAGEDLAALLDVPEHGPRRAASNGGAPAGGGGGPAGGARPAPTPAPRSGGCGGCGGASAGMIGGVLLVGVGRRRK